MAGPSIFARSAGAAKAAAAKAKAALAKLSPDKLAAVNSYISTAGGAVVPDAAAAPASPFLRDPNQRDTHLVMAIDGMIIAGLDPHEVFGPSFQYEMGDDYVSYIANAKLALRRESDHLAQLTGPSSVTAERIVEDAIRKQQCQVLINAFGSAKNAQAVQAAMVSISPSDWEWFVAVAGVRY